MGFIKNMKLKRKTKRYKALLDKMDKLDKMPKAIEEQYEHFMNSTVLPIHETLIVYASEPVAEAIEIIDTTLAPQEPIKTVAELDFRAGLATGRIYQMANAHRMNENQKELAINILNSRYEITRKGLIACGLY